MIVRKVKKNNYSMISNEIFKNKNLSLKAKGLLALCLSLPDDWDFNKNGLATFSADGRKSIESAIKELKDNHYLVINSFQSEDGTFDSEWVIYEEPNTQNGNTVQPYTPFPSTDKPYPLFPSTENGHLLINKKLINKKLINKNKDASHRLIYSEFEKIFPMAPTTWVIAIDKYIDILSDELIINAIKETAIAGVTNPKYFTAICERYKMNGYTKVTDIKTNKKNTKKTMDRDKYNKQFVEMMKNEKI